MSEDKRIQVYKIVDSFDKKSQKILKRMESNEKRKIMETIESFCVNGIDSPCFHNRVNKIHTDLCYLNPLTRCRYRVIIRYDDTPVLPTDFNGEYDGVVYLEAIVPRRDLELWLKRKK